MKLANYVGGRWVEGRGDGQALIDPVLGTELARASTEGIDFAAALDHARRIGGGALRALNFAERAALIGKIAETLQANRDTYGDIALQNSGNTKSDAAIDIDGAIGTLRYFARAALPLGAAKTLRDGGLIRMGKDEGFQALHVGVPLRGVAIHINAFNFPAWGLWEKVAVALLSGMPVLAKPATSTCWLAQRMVEDVIKAGVLPEGALGIVCGGAGDLLDHVGPSDAIAFTGSAATAAAIKSHRRVIEAGTRVNIEADLLNACLLGPDAAPGSAEFDLLVAEVAREMTVKAGQKCTAIRRVLAPQAVADQLGQAIAARLAGVKVGNPRNDSVRMGPLVNKAQQRAATDGIIALKREARVAYEGAAPLIDADAAKASFVAPTLLAASDPSAGRAVHEVEVFGPVSTILPYRRRRGRIRAGAARPGLAGGVGVFRRSGIPRHRRARARRQPWPRSGARRRDGEILDRPRHRHADVQAWRTGTRGRRRRVGGPRRAMVLPPAQRAAGPDRTAEGHHGGLRLDRLTRLSIGQKSVSDTGGGCGMNDKIEFAAKPETTGSLVDLKPMTGREYLASLDDGREVYIYGERVKKVTEHPAFRNTARMIARLYDALHDPKRERQDPAADRHR